MIIRFKSLLLAILIGLVSMMGSAIAQDAPSAQVASTISSRLSAAKFVGVYQHENIDGFVLYLYTPEQYDRHQESLKQYLAALPKYKKQLEALDQKRHQAQQSGASVDILNGITQERIEMERNRPQSHFERRIKLNRVVSVGLDFIEVESKEDSTSTVLMPFNKLNSIVFPKVTTTGDQKE